MDVAQARAVLTLDDTQYQREIKKAGQAFDQMGKDVEAAGKRAAANVGAALSTLGTRFSIGITAPLTALGAASVRSATQMDSLKRGLTAVAGSSAEAERQLKQLEEIAKLPGLGRVEAIQAATQLQAAGLSAKTAQRSLLAFGNALATVGKGKAELDGVTLALTQITAKGKVTAEEINQIAERVPQIRRVMQAAFGTSSTEELQKMGLTAKQFIEGVNNELLKLPRVTGGAQNAFENMQDALQKALSTIGQQLLPTVIPIVTRLAERAVALAEAFGKLPAPVRQAIVVVAALAAAAGPVLLVTGQLATAFGALKVLMPGLTTGMTGIKAAMIALPLPLKLIAVAVGALAAAWSTNFLGMRTTIQNFVGFVTPYLRGMWEVLKVDFADFVESFKAGWKQVSDWFTNVFILPFQTGVQMVREAMSGIGQAIGEALGPVGEWLGKAGQWIMDRVPGLDAVRDWFAGIGPMMERFRVIGQRAMDRDRMGVGGGAAAGAFDLAPVDIGPIAGTKKKTKQRADTPYEQQWKAYHQALNNALREQKMLKEGATDTAMSVARDYSLLDQPRRDYIAGILEENKAIKDTDQIWAQYRTTLQGAQSALADAIAGPKGGLEKLREQFSRKDEKGRIIEQIVPDDFLKKIMEANAATATHEDRTRKATEAKQRMLQMTASLGEQSDQLARQLGGLLSPAVDAAGFAWQELGVVWDDLSGTQKALVNDMFGMTRQITQLQEKIYLFKEVASGIQNVFMDAFSNIGQGFGSFFSSILGGFQRMLQQMAAQYLSSQIAGIFTRFLGNALGASFGGVMQPSSGWHAPMSLPGRAMGGYVGANKPYMVGERGPELFLPRNSGTIVPAGAGAGGGNVTIQMTVHTPDADSFRRNQGSMMADMWNEARRQQRRDGG